MKKIRTVAYGIFLLPILTALSFSQGADLPIAITVAPDGIIYVTGTSMNQQGRMEYITFAYDANGRPQGPASSLSDGAGPSIPSAIALLDDSSVIVTGTSPTTATGYDIVTVSIKRSAIVSIDDGSAPDQLLLSQSYPNPLVGVATAIIRFSLPNRDYARLVVMDAVGREVAVLSDGQQSAGWHEVSFQPGTLPAGTYYYVLTTPSSKEARRMVVLR